MSGAAGLAAAKRRRAIGGGGGGGGGDPPAPGGRTCRRNARTGAVTCGPGGQQQQAGGRAEHPLMVHMKRQEARLRRLEAGGAGGEGGGASEEVVEAQVQAVVGAAFEEVAGRVGALERTASQNASPDATDVAYFRNKTEEIESGVADLKRLLLKVQSFAMETNCALMKLSARVDKEAQSAAAGASASAPDFEAWEQAMEGRIEAAVQRKASELAGVVIDEADEADEADEDGEQEEEQEQEETA